MHGLEFMEPRVAAFVSELLHRVPKSRTTEMDFAKKKKQTHRGSEREIRTQEHIFPRYRLNSRSMCLSRGNLVNRRFIPCGVDAFVLIVIN